MADTLPVTDVAGQAFTFGPPQSFVTVGDTGNVIPSEVLLHIFQLAYHEPPTEQSLTNVIPYTYVGHRIGPDPFVVCSIRESCRLFRQVVDGCTDMRSSVTVAFPFRRSSPHYIVGPNSPDKIWWPHHITRFLAPLPQDHKVDVRLCVNHGIEELRRPKRLEMLRMIEPLLLRTHSLKIHCGDGRARIFKKTRFCTISRPLPLLEHLQIDNAEFTIGDCGLRPLLAVLQLVPNIKSLVLTCITISPAREHQRVVSVTMPRLKEILVMGNYDFLPTLIKFIQSSSPISFHVRDHNRPLAENPWPRPTMPPNMLLDCATMQDIWRAEMVTLMPLLLHSRKLHFIDTSFQPDEEQADWELLSAETCPLATELKLTRCNFWAGGLQSLYHRVATANTPGTPFSSLDVDGGRMNVIGPGIDGFVSWIKHSVARFNFHDGFKYKIRPDPSISAEAPPAPECVPVTTPTPTPPTSNEPPEEIDVTSLVYVGKVFPRVWEDDKGSTTDEEDEEDVFEDALESLEIEDGMGGIEDGMGG